LGSRNARGGSMGAEFWGAWDDGSNSLAGVGMTGRCPFPSRSWLYSSAAHVRTQCHAVTDFRQVAPYAPCARGVSVSGDRWAALVLTSPCPRSTACLCTAHAADGPLPGPPPGPPPRGARATAADGFDDFDRRDARDGRDRDYNRDHERDRDRGGHVSGAPISNSKSSSVSRLASRADRPVGTGRVAVLVAVFKSKPPLSAHLRPYVQLGRGPCTLRAAPYRCFRRHF
jgi:hypothetical protein